MLLSAYIRTFILPNPFGTLPNSEFINAVEKALRGKLIEREKGIEFTFATLCKNISMAR